MFLLWLRQLPPCGDRTPASVPPPKDRSSPTNTPILPPSSFLLPSFAWFYIFFSASQVLLSALSWCSACTSVSEGVFLMFPLPPTPPPSCSVSNFFFFFFLIIGWLVFKCQVFGLSTHDCLGQSYFSVSALGFIDVTKKQKTKLNMSYDCLLAFYRKENSTLHVFESTDIFIFLSFFFKTLS